MHQGPGRTMGYRASPCLGKPTACYHPAGVAAGQPARRKRSGTAMNIRPASAVLAAATFICLGCPAAAADAVSFQGQSVKMIIPTTAGGGTDIAARLFGRFVCKYLPGKPTIVPQNMPGGGGIAPLNFIAQQSKPDGLTIAFSSSTEADPITFRAPPAQCHPATSGT